MARQSLSLSTIFGVVPLATSAWNPLMAPQAMVMKTKGKSGPLMIGPPPWMYCVTLGIWMAGFTMTTPSTRTRMVPIFR